MMSWSDRAARRAEGCVFRPPGEAAQHEGWHLVDTHVLSLARLQWRPGTATWRNDEGGRWTAESAAELGWRYIRPAGSS